MGCVASKVKGSGLEPQPSKGKSTSSTSGKESKTKKSSEKSTSKDAVADKKRTAESKKAKSSSVKTKVGENKGVCPYGHDKRDNEGDKQAKQSGDGSKPKKSPSGLRKSIEKTFSKDRKSSSAKDKESGGNDKSARKDSKSKKDDKPKAEKSTGRHSSSAEKRHQHSAGENKHSMSWENDNSKDRAKPVAEKNPSGSRKSSGSSVRSGNSQNSEKTRAPRKVSLVSFDSSGARSKKAKPVPLGGSSPGSRLTKPKFNSFDEKPISQSKNLSTKSWWEMDDPGNSMDSSEPVAESKRFGANQDGVPIDDRMGDGFSSKPAASDRFGGDRRSSGHNDPERRFNEDRFNDEPSANARMSANSSRMDHGNINTNSNINKMDSSPQRANTNNNTNIMHNRAEAANDNEIINDFLDKPSYGSASRPRRQHQAGFADNDEFKSFADDFMNSTGGKINNSVKIEIPFDEIEEAHQPGRFPGGPAPAWHDDSQERAAGSPPVGRSNFRSDSPPLRGAASAQFSEPEGSGATSPPLRKSPHAPRFGGFSAEAEHEQDDSAPPRFSRPLASGPTDVPGSSPFEDEGQPPRPKFTPRPKFKRPLPLKRGAGMINRKASPIVKAPEDVINGIISRIPNIDNSKFNEHIKVQKELIEQMEKAPEAFAKTDLQLVIRTAKKIIEVAGGNRSNVSRSSLICLGHMFRILGSALNPLVVDAITLCAKKGVSSSPEHLVLASNFCTSKICQTSLEPKVASMLVSLYRNNKAYQLLCLSGMVVLLDRMGENILKLKNLDEIVDCAVKGTTTGGIPSRVASRNVLGMIDQHSRLDGHLNMCKCTEIAKVSIRQLLGKFDEESKAAFIEEFSKTITL